MQSLLVYTHQNFSQPEEIQRLLEQELALRHLLAPTAYWEFPNFPGKLLIDTVRAFQIRLTQSGGQQVTYFVLTDFQAASREVQNALLKSLEEPPENVCLILLTKNLSGILETVKSRCWLIQLAQHNNLSPNLDELDFANWSQYTTSKLAEKLTTALTDAYKTRQKTEADLTFGQVVEQALSSYLDTLADNLNAENPQLFAQQKRTLATLPQALNYLHHNVSAKNVLYFWAVAMTETPGEE